MTTWNDIMFDIYQIEKEVPMPYQKWVDGIHSDDINLVEESLNKVLDNKGVQICNHKGML